MSDLIDYRSDLYRALHLVDAVKRTSGGVERDICKIYRGDTLIWPKERAVKRIICVCWKDDQISSSGHFDCTSATGLDCLVDWRSLPNLYLNNPVETDAAYILDEYYDDTAGGHLAADPYSGVQYNMWTEDTSWTSMNQHTILGYYGRVYLNVGEVFELTGLYDDSAYFRIQREEGGSMEQIFFHVSATAYHSCSYTATRTGLHEFQILVGNRGGPSGPSGSTVTSPSGTGCRFYIITTDSVRHGPFRVGNIDSVLDAAIKERFYLPTAWDPTARVVRCSIDPAGSGTVVGTGANFHDGDAVTLVATPTTGSSFSHWTDAFGTTVGTSTSLSLVVNGDMSYTAHFIAPVTVSYWYSTQDKTCTHARHEESVASGSVPTAYTPSWAGMNFVKWEPADGSPEYGQPVTANASYTAVWTADLTFSNWDDWKTLDFALHTDSPWATGVYDATITGVTVLGNVQHGAAPDHAVDLKLMTGPTGTDTLTIKSVKVKGSTTYNLMDSPCSISSTLNPHDIAQWTLKVDSTMSCSANWRVDLAFTLTFT